ncbi:phage transcriptional regulator, AlpA [Nitrosomonas sp. Is79A3]|uniref:AlpA family phage regulatory protein n=1 Tax=Nitrosomonas sp. (strain Is79A3) TaxID=261292 RepID=UPI000215D1C0
MKFVKLETVKSMTGLSRSSIYQLINEGRFPNQVNLGSRSVAWVASEIEDWMNNCIANRSI